MLVNGKHGQFEIISGVLVICIRGVLVLPIVLYSDGGVAASSTLRFASSSPRRMGHTPRIAAEGRAVPLGRGRIAPSRRMARMHCWMHIGGRGIEAARVSGIPPRDQDGAVGL